MMLYGSLHAEFMRTEYNIHIRRCSTPINGNSIVFIEEWISNDNKRIFKVVKYG